MALCLATPRILWLGCPCGGAVSTLSAWAGSDAPVVLVLAVCSTLRAVAVTTRTHSRAAAVHVFIVIRDTRPGSTG